MGDFLDQLISIEKEQKEIRQRANNLEVRLKTLESQKVYYIIFFTMQQV
jgi:hypothetical protein